MKRRQNTQRGWSKLDSARLHRPSGSILGDSPPLRLRVVPPHCPLSLTLTLSVSVSVSVSLAIVSSSLASINPRATSTPLHSSTGSPVGPGFLFLAVRLPSPVRA